MSDLTYALLAVPFILLISVVVLQNFTASTQPNFENSLSEAQVNLTGACIPACTATYTTLYPVKDGTLTITAKNISGNTQPAYFANNSVTYDGGLKPLDFTVTAKYNGTVRANYTGYSAGGYNSFLKTQAGTWNGFNLASMLPFIIIALAIVGVILGAFVIHGAM